MKVKRARLEDYHPYYGSDDDDDNDKNNTKMLRKQTALDID